MSTVDGASRPYYKAGEGKPIRHLSNLLPPGIESLSLINSGNTKYCPDDSDSPYYNIFQNFHQSAFSMYGNFDENNNWVTGPGDDGCFYPPFSTEMGEVLYSYDDNFWDDGSSSVSSWEGRLNDNMGPHLTGHAFAQLTITPLHSDVSGNLERVPIILHAQDSEGLLSEPQLYWVFWYPKRSAPSFISPPEMIQTQVNQSITFTLDATDVDNDIISDSWSVTTVSTGSHLNANIIDITGGTGGAFSTCTIEIEPETGFMGIEYI